MEHKVLLSSVKNEKHNSKNMDLHEKDKNGYSGSTYEGVLEILDLLEQEEKECRFRVENSVDQVAQPSCEKYRSIVAYLEDIEREDQQRKCEIQSSETTEATRQKNMETDLNLQKLWGLQTEVEQKDKTIKVLHKLLTHQKDILKQQSKDLETEAKQKLDFQKQHYDATVQRHQTFIDQLIKDKKELTEKYEEVLLALKSSESKYAAKIKAQAERHAVDLQKTKALAAASEKITREKWISNQKKRIKEMTVKGLEPEIKQLMKSHHQELEQMKEAHQMELIQVEEKISSYYKHKMDQLREQLSREKEDACLQERELARERFEKQLEREETTYQQLRRRLHCSFEEEKEQLVQEISWIKKEQLQKLKELNERKQEEIVTLQNQFIQEKEKLKIDHEFKIKALQEKLDKKHDAWEKEKNEEFAVLLGKREKDIKEQIKIEREVENEMVTKHLEEKVKLTKEECEQAAERNESFMKERENVVDIIRQEFSADLEQLRKEKEGLAKKIQQQKQLHEQELQKLVLDLKLAKISNEETLEELDNRVRHTLSKKETVISQLSLKLEASKTRANHLEKLLEQQRQELLGT
ncbi:centrosomal protein of 131 kDa-like isoform X2 [Tachypleus tridentatus]|uniref:centrosomal protein of 131 kDa-like isoform X2 n=1 Tax=Tachypleus tridentatus TaxID=6853 RepID=UPI003FCF2334